MGMDLPIGVSDFRELREKQLVYVDKTRLIVEMLDHPGSKVLLLPRPRRFGKTLALSMLRYYFERSDEDLSGLFEGLEVWQAGEAYRRHFRRYPVMFLTFRDVKASTFEGCRDDLHKKIQVLFREHCGLLDSGVLDRIEAREYQAILDGAAAPIVYHHALGELSKYLHRATGERTIILIDEYDEPLRIGFVNGYGSQAIELFHTVLGSALKDNSHIERGVVTGVLWVPGSSIFSGLDNLHVHTLLQRSFSTCFGFTELDVAALLQELFVVHSVVGADGLQACFDCLLVEEPIFLDQEYAISGPAREVRGDARDSRELVRRDGEDARALPLEIGANRIEMERLEGNGRGEDRQLVRVIV